MYVLVLALASHSLDGKQSHPGLKKGKPAPALSLALLCHFQEADMGWVPGGVPLVWIHLTKGEVVNQGVNHRFCIAANMNDERSSLLPLYEQSSNTYYQW